MLFNPKVMSWVIVRFAHTDQANIASYSFLYSDKLIKLFLIVAKSGLCLRHRIIFSKQESGKGADLYIFLSCCGPIMSQKIVLLPLKVNFSGMKTFHGCCHLIVHSITNSAFKQR